MGNHHFVITVECDSYADAERVMRERLNYDEGYRRDDDSVINYSIKTWCGINSCENDVALGVKALEMLVDYGGDLQKGVRGGAIMGGLSIATDFARKALRVWIGGTGWDKATEGSQS